MLLDQLLAQYGPEARPIRGLMRRGVGSLVEQIWQGSSTKDAPFAATAVGEAMFAMIGELMPKTDAQRSLKARAIQVSTDLAQTRLALFVQTGSSVPKPFLAVLVFWLAIIYASFSLFARLNLTLLAALSVFALSASAALFLILELGGSVARVPEQGGRVEDLEQQELLVKKPPAPSLRRRRRRWSPARREIWIKIGGRWPRG